MKVQWTYYFCISVCSITFYTNINVGAILMCLKLSIQFLHENKYFKTAFPFPALFQHLKPVIILLLF